MEKLECEVLQRENESNNSKKQHDSTKKKRSTKKVMIRILIGIICFIPVFILTLYLLPFFKEMKVTALNGIEYTVYSDHAVATKYDNGGEYVSEVHIKESVLGRPVTVIGSFSFKTLKTDQLYIPDSVEVIEKCAFDVKTGTVNTIHLGNGLIELQEDAITNTTETTIVLPESLEIIERYNFISIRSVIIPSNVKKIGHDCFNIRNVDEIVFESDDIDISYTIFPESYYKQHTEEYVVCCHSLLKYNGNEGVEIVIPEDVNYVNALFPKDASVYITNNVKTVDMWPCFQCDSITFYIPDIDIDITASYYYGPSEEKIKIVTVSGSIAEQFAIANRIDYEIVDEIIYPEQ